MFLTPSKSNKKYYNLRQWRLSNNSFRDISTILKHAGSLEFTRAQPARYVIIIEIEFKYQIWNICHALNLAIQVLL
jgi:hypothetical protein